MQYNINAVLLDGTFVFSATAGWLPNKGDEIEAGGYVFVVKSVRYKIQQGTTYTTNVELRLAHA